MNKLNDLLMVFNCFYIDAYIISRLFLMGVWKNYRRPSATTLTHSSRLADIHTSGYTHTPIVSTTQLTFLNNLTNKDCFYTSSNKNLK